jgi:hypothetical protein
MCRWLHRWGKWERGASYHSPWFRFWKRRECRKCGHVQARQIDSLFSMTDEERRGLARKAVAHITGRLQSSPQSSAPKRGGS